MAFVDEFDNDVVLLQNHSELIDGIIGRVDFKSEIKMRIIERPLRYEVLIYTTTKNLNTTLVFVESFTYNDLCGDLSWLGYSVGKRVNNCFWDQVAKLMKE